MIFSDASILRVQLPGCENFVNTLLHLLEQRRLNPKVQDLHIDGCFGSADATTVPAEGCLPAKALIGAAAFLPPIIDGHEMHEHLAIPIAPLTYTLGLILFWILAHAFGVKLLLKHVEKIIAKNVTPFIGDNPPTTPSV